MMKIQILGTRGIPAQHGGFETSAESLALYLIQRGHEVTVYCQKEEPGSRHEDLWEGVHRVHVHGWDGASGTIAFDLRSVLESLRRPGLLLLLGYNTACFSILYRLFGRVSIMNMDGIEWKREKWSWMERLWLHFNEYAGSKLSTYLVADHPDISLHLQEHVSPNKISVIPYGADPVPVRQLPDAESEMILEEQGLYPDAYALIIARPEPENSLLEIIEAFSARSRNMKLFVLGKLAPEAKEYHRRVMSCASEEVIFPGAIYDKKIVNTLRRYARVYVHGHRVGGTNPSLVEALAASSAVIAHDNTFTRWVAGTGSLYFQGSQDLTYIFDTVLDDPERLARMREDSFKRYLEDFTQEKILSEYTALLQRFATKGSAS